MSEIIDDFWKKNGTIDKFSDAVSAFDNTRSSTSGSDGFSRLGAIGSLISAIMSFFG